MLALCSVSEAAKQGVLTGTVTGPSGAVFPNANVWIRWNDTTGLMGEGRRAKKPHQRELRTRTDDSGQFSLHLEPGTYDVFVYADAFEPACAIAFITPGEVRELKLRLPAHAGPQE